MSDTFSVPGGGFAAEVTIDGNAVYGTGSPEWPILVFPLQISFHGPSVAKTSLDFRELSCRLIPFNTCYIATSLTTALQLRLTPGKHVSNYLTHLEVPLDRIRIVSINRMRKGGDVKMKLAVELVVDELLEIASIQGTPLNSIWGIKEHHRMKVQTEVHIPRSRWIEQILPATGFGKIHILELPAIPLESCAAMATAFEALQQAYKFESEGLYVESVGKCRFALEPFLEKAKTQEGKEFTRLKASWETRLGKAAYDWLNVSFAAVKGPMNKAHHVSSTTFGQLEVQMLLTVTTALISYAIKTQPDQQ